MCRIDRRVSITRLAVISPAGLASFLLAASCASGIEPVDVPWQRHVIDGSSRGADGIRLADMNADGRLDIATGWEEGGKVRICFQPVLKDLKKPWPSVTAGEVGSPEDAVPADLDGDGRLDVVSSCEGKTNCVFVHWGPAKDRTLDSSAWQTMPLTASRDLGRWMYCLPLDLDGEPGLELICGSKGAQAAIGCFTAPQAGPRSDAWLWKPWYQAGWIMSLVPADIDRDGDVDLLASDRKGKKRGVLWLENPGRATATKEVWREHRIGGSEDEVMFLDFADLDDDGVKDVVVATSNDGILWHRRLDATGVEWETIRIPQPANCGTGKSVAVGKLHGGWTDLVLSCENAKGEKSGVVWLSCEDRGPLRRNWQWQRRELSGPAGTKFDRVELIDLDGDDDLDVLACEETENLGLFWYENRVR